ncbi:MAG: EF-P 5-aminopentanol modification-associated protein YfmF [bacterium]
MTKLTDFKQYTTDNKIDLYICKNPKFKTNLIQLVITNPLNDKNVSKNALVPFIIYRGSKEYPSSMAFKKHLDELYGAEFSVSVWKRGENQLINFALEIVNEKYLPTDEPLLEKGIELLRELLINPLFTEDFFQQEKEYIIKEIESLINDKYSYSINRCYQEMCKNEPYGLNKLGKIEDHKKLTRDQVYNQYKKMLSQEKIFMFVVGDVEEERVADDVNKSFNFEHDQPQKANNTLVNKQIVEVKEIEEKLNVQQGKLVMGFRTGITRADKLYYPLIIYNGILGGFPHSKLFQNVREKASLAYYASSNIESTKGLLMITSGIEFENYERTKNIILEQVEQLTHGNFTEEELDWTRKSIISQYKSSADYTRGLSGHYLLSLINDNEETITDSINSIARVSREDIIEVSKSISPDTIYFLNKKVGK